MWIREFLKIPDSLERATNIGKQVICWAAIILLATSILWSLTHDRW